MGDWVLSGALSGTITSGTVLPTWLATAAVGQWAQIPNTSAPAALKDYSGIAWRVETGKVEALSALAGGHTGNYFSNEVRSIDLWANTPTWVQRRASSDSSAYDTTGAGSAYYADGRPAPRHTYWDCIWVPERSRYMIGGRFFGSGAVDKNVCDAFNPATNDWDAAGTYANNPGGLVRGGRDPNTGIWYHGSGWQYNPTTDFWSTWANTGPTWNRGMLAWDSLRNHFFHLSTGDNFSFGNSVLSAVKVTANGIATAISFSASSAYTDFVANGANFLTSAIDYDPDADCYYFYNGGAEGAQKVYKITPDSGTTWGMSLLTVTGLTPAQSLATGGSPVGGVQNKVRYISPWRALVLIVPEQDIYFLRTA